MEGSLIATGTCVTLDPVSAHIAYAFINSWMSVYSNNWCNNVSAQMHEVGHNLNLGHSGEGTETYADQSGMLGFSYGGESTPRMCFNAAKNYQLGWYSDKTKVITPGASTDSCFSGDLYGTAFYGNAAAETVGIKVNNAASSTDVYIMFNAKTGIQSGTVEGGNTVMVVTAGGEGTSYAESTLHAKLSPTTTGYSLPGFTNTILHVDSRVDNQYVTIRIETDGQACDEGLAPNPPTVQPTNSPSPNPTPAPSNSPTSNPTAEPTTASPTPVPTNSPSPNPTPAPVAPTNLPTPNPTAAPVNPSTSAPSNLPTPVPSAPPTNLPTSQPTSSPTTASPTDAPTSQPTGSPISPKPTSSPTTAPPSNAPTPQPTSSPTSPKPTSSPTTAPTTSAPTPQPTSSPTSPKPTSSPTTAPTMSAPTPQPTESPTTAQPTSSPTTAQPTSPPSPAPTSVCGDIQVQSVCNAQVNCEWSGNWRKGSCASITPPPPPSPSPPSPSPPSPSPPSCPYCSATGSECCDTCVDSGPRRNRGCIASTDTSPPSPSPPSPSPPSPTPPIVCPVCYVTGSECCGTCKDWGRGKRGCIE